nr:MAG TPA: hypothetical protein [Caudoviricetes sp.]
MKRQFKSPEIREAKAAILKFLQDHNLNPMKDYSKHPKYGREFSMLLMKLTKERQKIEKIYPQLDIKNQTKHLKAIMAKKEKKAAIKAAEKELKKASLTKKESKKKPVKEAKDISSKKAKTKEAKEKKERKPRVLKYDYPLVNGKEMSPDQKKKYRIEQRKLAQGENPEKESKVSKKTKEAPVKETKKVKKVSKEAKVEKKSKKKIKKEED